CIIVLQAEDGIRDLYVMEFRRVLFRSARPIVLASNTAGTLAIGNTGAAISTSFSGGVTGSNNLTIASNATTGTVTLSTAAVNNRSEERRVGKESSTTGARHE